MKTFTRLTLAALLLTGSAAAPAAVIIATSTYYNSGLGTLLDTSGPNDPFPCANIGCGDNTVSYPTAPDLSAASAQLGTWLTNAAPTGGAWTGPSAVIPDTWAVNTETAIVYGIDAGLGLTNLTLSLGVDNGIFVWVDGVYRFGARAAGGASQNEYVLALADMSAGMHYIQIMREDHGGGTGYYYGLSGSFVQSVPEPATLGLLGLGLAGIGLSRKRKSVSV
jgi:hypothetical protein